MRYRNWALACSVFALMLSVAARADINSYRLGDGTGEDWEPAIVSDGTYVYARWPHFLASTPKSKVLLTSRANREERKT